MSTNQVEFRLEKFGGARNCSFRNLLPNTGRFFFAEKRPAEFFIRLSGGINSAGGLGMAGGAAVLGGLVAGPALAIFGSTMNAKAEANLENARTQRAKVRKDCEEVKVVIDGCNNITERADMFTNLLYSLDILFGRITDQLEDTVSGCGIDYRDYSDSSRAIVGISASVAKAVKTVIDTPILTKEGKADDGNLAIYREYRNQLENMEENT